MKNMGESDVGYREAARKQRGNDGIWREARFYHMLKRGFGVISRGNQSDRIGPLYF